MIRPMRPEDAAAVATLVRTAFAAIPVPLDPPASATRLTEQAVRDHLATGAGLVWDDGGIGGAALLQLRPRGLYLGRLSVHPARAGRGIARQLLAAAEAHARTCGAPRLLVEVRLALASNRRLFAAAGFTETVRRAHPGYAHPTFTEAEKPLLC